MSIKVKPKAGRKTAAASSGQGSPKPKKVAQAKSAKMAGSTTASVKRICAEIEAVLELIPHTTASNLKKRRAQMMLSSVLCIIEAFCLAEAGRRDLAEAEFEVRRRAK